MKTIGDEIESYEKQLDFVKKREQRRIYHENRRNVPNWFGI